jgi:formyltetrahydrofolate-dependent phosphoribosylglycinamide formyltransferase
MFNKLQQKWKVSSSQLFFILCTFAVTGTTTAFISRSITSWVGFNEQTFWAWKLMLRMSILIFGYQVIILIVAFLFGQFPFFWNYEKKILRRLGILPVKQVRIAIFASGKGSNAGKIIEYFDKHLTVNVSLIVCNKPGAGVLDIAEQSGIKSLLIDKETFKKAGEFSQILKDQGITHIVLAGFLWKIPAGLIAAYQDKILNIHPAMLPKFGGKGMFGEHVHAAVLAAGDKQSGITIHLVDEQYDHGKTIFQTAIDIHPGETPDSLDARIHVLEHEHFPSVIESWVS